MKYFLNRPLYERVATSEEEVAKEMHKLYSERLERDIEAAIKAGFKTFVYKDWLQRTVELDLTDLKRFINESSTEK